MAAAHQVIRLHRDIKPQNLLLAKVPHSRESIKVIDFGLAKVREDAGLGFTSSASGNPGTPAYASPEQWKAAKDIDHRSDLYSLGLVLYEMLTRKLPPPHDRVDKDPGSIQQARPDLSFPPALSALVTKALARDRDRRFQKAEEMEDAVLALLESANPARDADRTVRTLPEHRSSKVNPKDGLTYVWIPRASS